MAEVPLQKLPSIEQMDHLLDDLHLGDQYITSLIELSGSLTLIDTPWRIADKYAMSDIIGHVTYRVMQMEIKPKRLRVSEYENEFDLVVQD